MNGLERLALPKNQIYFYNCFTSIGFRIIFFTVSFQVLQQGGCIGESSFVADESTVCANASAFQCILK